MDELMRIYGNITQKLAEEERICLEIRSLLNEWPVNPLKQEKAVMPSNSHETVDDGLTDEERAQLSLVSDALNKAQRIREKSKVSSQTKPLSSKPPPAPSTTAQKSPPEKTPAGPPRPAQRSPVEKVAPASRSNPKDSKPPRPVTSSSTRSSGTLQKSANKENFKIAPSKEKAATRPSRKELMDRYSTKRKPTPRSGVAPAHVSAPYKTNPHLHEKRTLPRSRSADFKKPTCAVTPVQRDGSVNRISGNSSRDAVVKRTGTLTSSVSSSDLSTNRSNKDRTTISDVSDPIVDVESDQATSVSDRKTRLDTGNGCGDVDDGNGSGGVIPSDHHEGDVETADSAAEDLPFLLERDGSRLKMPLAWRKAHKTNRLLRRRLDTELTSNHHRQAFITRLENMSCGSSWHRQSGLLRRIDRMSDEYDRLCRILEDLNLDSVSASSSYSVKLYHYRMVEHVLTRYYEWETEFNQLQQEIEEARAECTTTTSVVSQLPERLSDENIQAMMLNENKTERHFGPMLYRSRDNLVDFRGRLSDKFTSEVKLEMLKSVLPQLDGLMKQVEDSDPDAVSSIERLVASFLLEAPSPRGMLVPTPRAFPVSGR